jgi:hypothetical protein
MKHEVKQSCPCFCCGKWIKAGRPAYDARVVGEDTRVWVGPDCYRRIKQTGTYQPYGGGPALAEWIDK